MDNFNLKKYLAEGKLKENFEFTEKDIDEMQETAFMAGWNLSKKGVGKGSLYSSAESAFRMWNSEQPLMEDLEEEYRGQMGSQTAQDLAVSKARFSNAILALNKEDFRTAEEVENEYIRVGMMMKNHLKFLFDDYLPHPSLDQI